MGGPIRVVLAGYDAIDKKVFFRQQQFDESGRGPETFYIQLGDFAPSEPILTESLDKRKIEVNTFGAERRWLLAQHRLRPLAAQRDAQMSVRVNADSVGIDPEWNSPRFSLRVELEANDMELSLTLTSYCRTDVSLRGLYSIPGRHEVIAILAYAGLAYGCEDRDQVVVFSLNGN